METLISFQENKKFTSGAFLESLAPLALLVHLDEVLA
jgi:hypothetical protein